MSCRRRRSGPRARSCAAWPRKLRTPAFDRAWTIEAGQADAVLMPVTVVLPTMAELQDEESYGRLNLLILRNPTVTRLMVVRSACHAMPCHADGEAPVGMILATSGGHDSDLLRAAMGVEPLLRNVSWRRPRVAVAVIGLI